MRYPLGSFNAGYSAVLKKRHKRDNVLANAITYSAVDCLIANEAIPVQAWTGPEDYRKLRLPDFKKIGTLR